MHMIPPRKSQSRPIDLSDAPDQLAATLWSGGQTPSVMRRNVLTWIAAIARPIVTAEPAWEAIAYARGLPQLEKALEPAELHTFCNLLCGLAAEIAPELLETAPLVHQLLATELAATLAKFLPDGKASQRMAALAKAAASRGLNQILDSQGMPRAAHYHLMFPLLACWTRAYNLAAALPDGTWGPRATQRYQLLLRNVLRTARPDGQPALSGDEAQGRDRRPLEAALLVADEPNRRIAAVALAPKNAKDAPKRKQKLADLPSASLHCENAAIAVLRRDWDRDAERLVVRFAGQTCAVELVASGRVAASGDWRFAISSNGQPVAAIADWESICWHSDADVDYLELQLELAEGVILQRHMVLAREDRFLLLADALLTPSPANWEYRGIIPLAAGVSFSPAVETREGLLAGVQPLAHVLPLALPEWQTAEPWGGELAGTARGLELRQMAVGQRLFAPLFIDLDRQRFRRRMTWRALTVAESLLPVPADRAVGYRIAIGAQQWIVYRSLAPTANRTLLGHNLSTETLVARFSADGEIAPIIEIE